MLYAAVRTVHGCGVCVQYLSKLSRTALGHQQPGQASLAQSGSNCETASVGAGGEVYRRVSSAPISESVRVRRMSAVAVAGAGSNRKTASVGP